MHTFAYDRKDPIQLVWMVNQFGRLATSRPRPFSIFGRQPPEAAGGENGSALG
jgi:hypothetical protein